jgi:uncharacterized oligopeptide transporter (OPT) family protein
MNSNLAPAPQLTARAIVLAVVLAVILAAANTYLGLFAGMTIASAIPAAVVSMAVLRALGGGGILETTSCRPAPRPAPGSPGRHLHRARAGAGLLAGFQVLWVLPIAGLGGLLGVLFSVPLRRSLIVDQQMTFPEGKAAAEVLRAGENPAAGIKVLGLAALGGAIGKLFTASGFRLIPDSSLASGFIGKYLGYMGTNLSPALLGEGYIVPHIGVASRWQLPRSTSRFRCITRTPADNPAPAATVAGACQPPALREVARKSRGAQIRYPASARCWSAAPVDHAAQFHRVGVKSGRGPRAAIH